MLLEVIETTEQKVRIRFCLSTPDSIPDKQGVIEVPYVSIPDLPRPPSQIGFGCNYHVDVDIPKLNRPITFIIDSFCESSSGPNEENLYGPYLKERIKLT